MCSVLVSIPIFINLEAIFIPDSVLCIGRMSFRLCVNLASTYFSPQSYIQHIEANFFQYCINLQFFNNLSTTISIYDKAFDRYHALSITPNVTSRHQELNRVQRGYDILQLQQATLLQRYPYSDTS